MKKLVISGGVSRSLEIGRQIRQALGAKRDPALAAAEAMGGWIIFRGRIAKKEWESRDGYMFGNTTIQGQGPDDGHNLKIWLKNENHVTYLDDKGFVTSPDLITIIDSCNGEPYTNTMLEEGMEVAILGSPAEEKYRSAKGLAILGPRYFGFDMDYVPIEKHLNK